MKLVRAGGYGALAVASLAAVALFAAHPAQPSASANSTTTVLRRPVLLELFTSEGCSSCPPADRLLDTFDHTQPVPEADLIVLSEHVDYWNRLGWTDPYSSPLFTQRQQDYVNRFHLESAYTPQLVVDGQRDVVGSDAPAAKAAILRAATRAKTAIDLNAQRSGSEVRVELRVGGGLQGANVFVALADDHAQSQVTGGENSGYTLRHVAVVRAFLLAGKTRVRGAFARDLTLPLRSGNDGAWRIVVFLQNPDSKLVLGAAQMRI